MASAPNKQGKAVLMICGDYMEDYEAAVPALALRGFGIAVDCVSPGKKPGEKCITAIHDYLGFELYTELPGHGFVINADFHTTEAGSYDALIIPGGRFTDLFSSHGETLAIAAEFASSTAKPIMTTCHSQLILAAAGALDGVRCTAFPSMKHIIGLAGGSWSDPDPPSSAVLDRNIVSAIGWPAHAELIAYFLQSMGVKISGLQNQSVLFLFGDYVEDYEINVPFRALNGLGCKVEAACPTKKKGEACVTAIHDDEGAQVSSEKRGHNFTATLNWGDVVAADYDCLVIAGGRSPELLVGDEAVLELVREIAGRDKVVAGIGQGQLVLAAAGLLKSKRCASGYGMKAIVKLAGGEVDESMESLVDGRLLTATGWSALPQFINDLMGLLGLSLTF